MYLSSSIPLHTCLCKGLQTWSNVFQSPRYHKCVNPHNSSLLRQVLIWVLIVCILKCHLLKIKVSWHLQIRVHPGLAVHNSLNSQCLAITFISYSTQQPYDVRNFISSSVFISPSYSFSLMLSLLHIQTHKHPFIITSLRKGKGNRRILHPSLLTSCFLSWTDQEVACSSLTELDFNSLLLIYKKSFHIFVMCTS